ncbi:MAG: hypothetical protein Q7S22_05660 [Candidatus Micrarchaeota archaeon]|nr:hypothetical protein [Candidatus Micrarchaeota archaeon]
MVEYVVGWEGIAISVSMVAIIASAIVYMFSKVFDLKNLEQTAKTELIYAISTVFIVLMLITFVTGGESMLVSIATNLYATSVGLLPGQIVFPPGTHLTDIMIMYMDPAAACARTLMRSLYVASIPVEAGTSVYMEIFMSEHASGFGFKILAERIKNATELTQFYMFFYYLLIHISKFIGSYGLFILSLGVILRAFPPTRGAGGYVMALSLGLYFIFPFTYIISSAISLPVIRPSFMGQPTLADPTAVSNSITHNPVAYVCALPALEEVQYCGYANPSKVYEVNSWINAYRGDIDSLTNVLSPAILKQLTVSVCFLPMISMVIVFSFVLSTTSLLGGNIPEIGRGLIKLI